MNWKDIAILCRTKSDFERFETALARCRIPYQVVGGQSFFDRREVKDIMALLSWMINLNSQQSLSRFCKNMVTGLGENAFDTAYVQLAEDDTLGPITLHGLHQELGKKKSKKNDYMQRFIMTIHECTKHSDNAVQTLAMLDLTLGLTIKLKEQTTKDPDKSGYGRDESLAQLKQMATDMKCDLKEFVDQVALLGAADEEETDNKLVLSTIHASKGREFSIVIIPALYDGKMPHFKAESAEEFEQELNAYYVAKTRAKDVLIMTRPGSIKTYGPPFVKDTVRSPFIANDLKKLQELGQIRLYNAKSKQSTSAE